MEEQIWCEHNKNIAGVYKRCLICNPIRKDEIKKKYLYCPKCKTYPDKTVEMYDYLKETREWNPETGDYEVDETFYSDESVLFCGRIIDGQPCETQLEETTEKVDQEKLNKDAQEKGSE